MARGSDDVAACEMTKWFDTNYHYVVPEIHGKFEFEESRPLKFYLLAKEKFAKHLPLYSKVLKELENNGVRRVRIKEPALVLELTDKEAEILIEAYALITKDLNIAVYVQTYYESLSQYIIKSQRTVRARNRNGFCRELRKH
jgi:5-methyltetrahydropteroyltriglutamate--homocysteine methyltransferase